MTGGKDEYYRPWLDRIDDPAGEDGAPGKPVAGQPSQDAKAPPATRSPDNGTAIKHDSGATLAATMLAGLKRGWRGFAATTIRWGESADIPARVAALELGDKAQRLGKTVARESGKAGRAVAGATVAAGKASGRALGKAGAKSGSAIGDAAARTRAATRKGIDSSIEATKTQGGKIAAGAKQAARPVIDRAIPPKPATPVVGSALDRLVADEQESAGTQDKSRAGDLPLFGDFAATDRPAPAAVIAEDAGAASAEATPMAPASPRGRSPESTPPAGASANAGPVRAAGDDDAAPGVRKRQVAIGLGIVLVLAIAILAGRSFWGLGGNPGDILASAPAPAAADRAAALTGIDDDRRAEIEAVVEAYILDHPEIIPQALDRLQKRDTATAIARLRPAIERPFAGAWGGNPDGDVVITEYSDFACTFCRRSLPDVERLIKSDPGVKIVYRELPILTAQSGPAAKVALAAARKGRYRDFHLALFALGQPSDANIATAAAKAGMTPEDVAAARSDPALDREITSNVSVAQQLRFEGTPSFVVGDQVLHGAVGYDALKAAVAKARE